VEGRGARAGTVGGHEVGTDLSRGGGGERRTLISVGGEHATLSLAEGGDGAVLFGALAEDEAEEHVDAANGEEEEGGDEGEVVDVVAEDGRANKALEDTERAETECGANDGEESVEETGDDGVGELGKEEGNNLKNDENTLRR
jgi:hypothetical protein